MVGPPASVDPVHSALEVTKEIINVSPHLINGRTRFFISNDGEKDLSIKFDVSPYTIEGTWSFFVLNLPSSYYTPKYDAWNSHDDDSRPVDRLILPADGKKYGIDVVFSVPRPKVYTIYITISDRLNKDIKFERLKVNIDVLPYKSHDY
ncbi:unnamed protein product, partial [Mesorhabditis belari]|uniref:Uncharacterized protein n=1 Tax=Mesorhabditis belari TaxID=2138241 RepID=A0AAF3EF86_9BILA